MALPPLAPVRHLRRLLGPEEVLLYTVRFHPLRGWPFLAVAVAFFGTSYLFPLAILGTVLFALLWYWPLHGNEVAVTADRLLLRVGRYGLKTMSVADTDLLHWEVLQNPVGIPLHAGDVALTVKLDGQEQTLRLPWVWHPFTFLEALEAMQDEEFRARADMRDELNRRIAEGKLKRQTPRTPNT